jgi:sugar/nucleoside kinase (ribokinase family)
MGKGIKRLILMVIAVLAMLLLVSQTAHASSDRQYKTCRQARRAISKKFSKYGKVKFIQTKNLTNRMLLRRKGSGEIIVEVCKGKVMNRNGDGKVFNTGKEHGYYMNYSGLKGIRKGSRVTTYCVYEWGNNYTDAVGWRYDVVTKY